MLPGFSLASSSEIPAAGAASLAPGLNFEGGTRSDNLSSIEKTAPDAMGAVGPSEVVYRVNDRYAVFRKSDGSELASDTPRGFWSGAGVDLVDPFDPRVHYDHLRQKSRQRGWHRSRAGDETRRRWTADEAAQRRRELLWSRRVRDPLAFRTGVVQRGGAIWAVHPVGSQSDRDAIEWLHFDAATHIVLQSGLIEDPALDFILPSLAVNEHGEVVIGFTATSAAMVDPIDSGTFWTFQEWVSAEDDWAAQVTQLFVVPEPGTTLLLACGLSGHAASRRSGVSAPSGRRPLLGPDATRCQSAASSCRALRA